MKKHCNIWSILLGAIVFSNSAMADYAISLAYGQSNKPDGLKAYQVGVQKLWAKKWFEHEKFYLSGYWDVQAGYVKANANPGENKSLYQIAVLPSLRFNIALSNTVAWYLDAGIGPGIISKTSLGNRQMSTAFQFYNQVGTGLRFGTKQVFDLGVYYVHLSNASIKRPNTGMDMLPRIKLAYYF